MSLYNGYNPLIFVIIFRIFYLQYIFFVITYNYNPLQSNEGMWCYCLQPFFLEKTEKIILI